MARRRPVRRPLPRFETVPLGEGTYPLPEAQLDRFMFKVLVAYPDEEEELAIVKRTTSTVVDTLSPVLSREQIGQL